MTHPTYTDEQVREILRRAIDRQHSTDGVLTQVELIDAAAELGIDAATVRSAAIEILELREVDATLAQRKRKRWRGFFRGLSTYVVINAFLFGFDWLDGTIDWVQYVLLGWGLFLATHLLSIAFKQDDPEQVRRELSRKREREAKRAMKQAAREARARSRVGSAAEQAFEAAVEAGVTALLNAAQRHLAPTRSTPDTDFGRYVARKDGRTRAESRTNSGSPPRVRVDESAAEPEEAEFQPRQQRRPAHK